MFLTFHHFTSTMSKPLLQAITAQPVWRGLWRKLACCFFGLAPWVVVLAGESVTPQGVPLYATQPPTAMTLHYALQRGRLKGEGDLTWAPEGARYALTLDGRIAGLQLLQQSSVGQINTYGLAPQQFSDQRVRGPARVAVFHQDKGLISFSGGAPEVPWVPGTQDRLSWMVQLPAVVRAGGLPPAAGKKVELYVSGARGDADRWTFRFVATEDVVTEWGIISALRWVREPRRPQDTAVEVWLDATLQHMPVRAILGGGAEGEALELVLRKLGRPL
jgi:hypothetical protein